MLHSMSAAPRKPRREPWHAVSVVAPSAACPAALALRDKRFLSGEAPRLPLSDCENPAACPCIYKHHPDRRAGPRRESEERYAVRAARLENERRAGRGRRTTD